MKLAFKNQERASRIETVLREYALVSRSGIDIATNFQDMLSDMMHFCDLHDLNFEEVLHMAAINHQAEQDGNESFIWLNDGEKRGDAFCGCRLVTMEDGNPAFFMCEKHQKGFEE